MKENQKVPTGDYLDDSSTGLHLAVRADLVVISASKMLIIIGPLGPITKSCVVLYLVLYREKDKHAKKRKKKLGFGDQWKDG
jgi:hypothetical protein